MIAALKESTLSSCLGTACCFLSTAPARTLPLLHVPCVPAPARLFCSHLLAVTCGIFLLRERSLVNRTKQESSLSLGIEKDPKVSYK